MNLVVFSTFEVVFLARFYEFIWRVCARKAPVNAPVQLALTSLAQFRRVFDFELGFSKRKSSEVDSSSRDWRRKQ